MTTQIPKPGPDDVARAVARWPETTLADLERGRSLYVTRCGSCHRLIEPRHISPEAWPAHVDDMSERAKLEPEQAAAVSRYLVTVAGRPDDDGPGLPASR